MNRYGFLILSFILLAVVLGVIYITGTPRLVSFSPGDGDAAAPPGATLQLTFSRPMNHESLVNRLQIDPPAPGSFSWEANTLVFTPDQPWDPGERITVILSAGARASSMLAAPIREEFTWSFSIRETQIVYLFPANGPANIYTSDPSTSQTHQLTEYPGGVLGYHVNQDGTSIFYSILKDDISSQILRLDTGVSIQSESNSDPVDALSNPEPELVLDCPGAVCRTPRISPSGEYLAYERTAFARVEGPHFPQVWYITMNQDAPPAPVLAGGENHQTTLPNWSPDGLLGFYDRDIAAFTFYNPASGSATSFSNQTGELGTWHPSGNFYVTPEISFISSSSDANTELETLAVSHLIQFNLVDGSTEDLTRGENLEDTSPAYAPDGSVLAFGRKYLDDQHWTPGRQLWIDPEGAPEALQYTNNPNINHYDFAWNPDSSRLVYVRFDKTQLTAPPEIWILDPGTGASQRIIEGGFAPKWIP